MNANTNKTPTSPSLTDQAEAVSATLEKAIYTLRILAERYENSGDGTVLMAVEDLVTKARTQLQPLIGELAYIPRLEKNAQDFALLVHHEMFKAESVAKSISAWSCVELVGGGGVLDMNKGDIATLSDMVVTLAQALGKQADDYAFTRTWGALA